MALIKEEAGGHEHVTRIKTTAVGFFFCSGASATSVQRCLCLLLFLLGSVVGSSGTTFWGASSRRYVFGVDLYDNDTGG